MTWWTPWRAVGPVEILAVDLRPHPALDELARAWLDADERKRADRRRRQFARCRAALRFALCERGGFANRELRFEYGEHGKPRAVVPGRRPPSFNVSHSGDHGLIAFAPSGRVGVDLEVRRPGRDFDGVGRRVFGARERAAGEEAFYRLWTMKEALIKAVGAGFTLQPARFEVPAAMIAGAVSGEFRFPHLPDVRWRLHGLDEPRFAAALAFEA